MKKIILLAGLMAVLAIDSSAQFEKEDFTIAHSIFSKSKKLMVSEYMNIKDEPSQERFWKLYDEYEAKRKVVHEQLYLLLKQYADNYLFMDDEIAKKVALGFLESNTEMNKINKIYFKKFSKTIGSLQAAKLLQVECYIQTAVQADLQSGVPIIGELQKVYEQQNVNGNY